MNRTKGHISKSNKEKNAYVKYIRKLDYEPTQDEALDFSDSSDHEADYSIQKANNVKRLTNWEKFQLHFEENWPRWIVAGAALVISYFIFSSQVSFNKIDVRMDQIDKDVKNINSNVEEIKNTNHQQDLKIQKNEILIENVKENQKQEKKLK